MKTITGNFAPALAVAGAQTFDTSDLPGRLLSEIMIDVVIPQRLDAFRHYAISVVHAFHVFTGCGSRQRFSRTGGAT